jgi:hypothetical protein
MDFIWRKIVFRIKILRNLLILLTVLCFSVSGVRAADILFVTAEDDPLDVDDALIVNFLEGLGHNIILIDDDEDEATTEAAAQAADLVFISESVNSGNIRNEITEIATPMIITEAWGWDEMGLTLGGGGGIAVASPDITIVNPGHFLAAGLSGTVPVLTTTGSARFATGIAGNQASVIARATLSDGQTYDVIYVYEKGAALPVAPADGSPSIAAEMRICFGFDELSYSLWNENAYQLLSAAVKYALGITGYARNPKPANGQKNVALDVLLSWSPGENAQKHDVYFGTVFDDVNSAGPGSPLLVGPGQDANTYNPGRLEFDRTYYWRVDEIDNSTITKGEIWNFTAETIGYLIPAENIIATASSQEENQGPENTIDGSGLVDDYHSTVLTDMWLTPAGQPAPAWIKYEFDKVYKLHEMLIWNYNGQSYLSALGLKDVIVEYSTDDSNWMQIEGISEFARATGADDYVYNTTVAFDGIRVRFVKITATSNWTGGFFDQYGLSEVQFLHIPVFAKLPSPDDGATDVAIDVSLGWRPGREAAEHNVFLSADRQAVMDETAPVVTLNQAAYGPLSLDLGQTYYWRIDEVNQAETPSVWQGDIWSFTTSQYLVVDDFESYNDIPEGQEGSHLVYLTWIDGYNTPTTNGSTMGYVSGSSLESSIVHGGGQSAPVIYDNRTASLSEVTANTSDLEIGRDWTVGAPATLSLWFYGDADNSTTDRMYVKVNSAKVMYDGDLRQADWRQFTVDLASLGINLGNVTMLSIGFERTGATGGSGTVFIDDIALYSPIVVEQ